MLESYQHFWKFQNDTHIIKLLDNWSIPQYWDNQGRNHSSLIHLQPIGRSSWKYQIVLIACICEIIVNINEHIFVRDIRLEFWEPDVLLSLCLCCDVLIFNWREDSVYLTGQEDHSLQSAGNSACHTQSVHSALGWTIPNFYVESEHYLKYLMIYNEKTLLFYQWISSSL